MMIPPLEFFGFQTKADDLPFLIFFIIRRLRFNKVTYFKSLSYKRKIDFQEIKISPKINVFFVFF
ncbi:hypothetical protein EG347_21000 [Chryseobacterium sp. G0186]|nr:hypothetical protein EG347_21000 [Chryseobacterium sp. G0186]